MRYLIKLIIASAILSLIFGCTTFTSTLDTNKKVKLDKIKRGKVCAKYIFGTLKVPWIGQIGIKLSGDESATSAMKQGKITQPFGIDQKVKNYFVYSKKCIIVYGQ